MTDSPSSRRFAGPPVLVLETPQETVSAYALVEGLPAILSAVLWVAFSAAVAAWGAAFFFTSVGWILLGRAFVGCALLLVRCAIAVLVLLALMTAYSGDPAENPCAVIISETKAERCERTQKRAFYSVLAVSLAVPLASAAFMLRSDE